ncbi:BrnT family toxin [bacterium]|nr:BrnT family toxin [bacterium]MBU3956488.1 BrnT family toxin [bacterium]
MEILSLPVEFEWDKYNTEKIETKHKINPAECEEVFFNMLLMLMPDIKHSRAEARYQALGKTNTKRLLFIVFTVRNRKIRVITARGASRKERRMYNEAA